MRLDLPFNDTHSTVKVGVLHNGQLRKLVTLDNQHKHVEVSVEGVNDDELTVVYIPCIGEEPDPSCETVVLKEGVKPVEPVIGRGPFENIEGPAQDIKLEGPTGEVGPVGQAGECGTDSQPTSELSGPIGELGPCGGPVGETNEREAPLAPAIHPTQLKSLKTPDAPHLQKPGKKHG